MMAKYLSTAFMRDVLMFRIKTISMSVIAKMKADVPDFEFDFETFVKELSTDDAVFVSFRLDH